MTNLPLDIMHEFDLCVKQKYQGWHTSFGRQQGCVFGERNFITNYPINSSLSGREN